jgi:hypothetical protein
LSRAHICHSLSAQIQTGNDARTVTSRVVGAPNTSMSGMRTVSPPRPRTLRARATSCQRCKSRKQSRGISDAPLAHCVPRVTHGRGNDHVAAPKASCGCNAVNYSASTLRTVSLHAPQRVVRCSQSTMSPPDWLKAGSMLGPTHYDCGVSSYTSVEARDSEAKCAHHSHFGDIVVEDLDAAAEARHEPQAS